MLTLRVPQAASQSAKPLKFESQDSRLKTAESKIDIYLLPPLLLLLAEAKKMMKRNRAATARVPILRVLVMVMQVKSHLVTTISSLCQCRLFRSVTESS